MSPPTEEARLNSGLPQEATTTATDPPKASDLKVHPVAAAFPMLADDELKALAGDIAANGLRQPIVIQGGVLIDGRNRLRACELAGVEPTAVELAAEVDPVAYILSANLARRHLSKGQQALALARAEIAAGGWDHGHKSELSSDFGISTRYMAMAKTVIEEPALVDEVAAGSRSLRDGYDLITERRANIEAGVDYFAKVAGKQFGPVYGPLERVLLAEVGWHERTRARIDELSAEAKDELDAATVDDLPAVIVWAKYNHPKVREILALGAEHETRRRALIEFLEWFAHSLSEEVA